MIASAVSRWSDDPWAQGSWSLIGRHGTPHDRIALGQPIAGRLRIAGEATHPTRAGMTHGAYEQGLAAADWAHTNGHHHVIVIGAGMTGLGAARRLREHGRDVRILEARHRIGGRTTGVHIAGHTFDLGANWLQQYDDNLLARLAATWELPVVPTEFAALDHEDELRRRLATAPEHASVADVVDHWCAEPGAPETEIRRLVDAAITIDSGAPLDWLSARHGFEPGVGEGDRWIIGGYQRLVDHLAAELPVTLGTPVRDITVTADRVLVNGTLQADAVIATVPLGPLRDIRFTPELPPPHRRALTHLRAGRVEKIILRAPKRFWTNPEPYFRIHGPSSGSISEWLDATPADGTPTLVGLLAGPWLDHLWTGTDTDITTRVLSDVLPAAG